MEFSLEFLNRRPASYASHTNLIDEVTSASDFQPERFRQEILKREPSNCSIGKLISNEELSGHPLGYDLLDPFETAVNLSKAFPEAKIIVVTRNQLDLLTSLYCYRVASRGHESRSFDRFIHEGIRDGLIGRLKFERLIKHYEILFGTQRLLVLPMEKLTTDSTGFTTDLCEFMGAAPPKLDSETITNWSTRQSLPIKTFRFVNSGFKTILLLRALVDGRGFAELDPKRTKVGPYWHFRNRYYKWQRKSAERLSKRMPQLRKFDPLPVFKKYDLDKTYRISNDRLKGMPSVKWDPAAFGYITSDA